MRCVRIFNNEKKIIVIRPDESLNIDNLEKNNDRFKEIYNKGYEDGEKYIEKVKSFIGERREIR